LINLIDNHSFKKVLVKINLIHEQQFINNGFYREVYITNFYNNGDGCCYLSYIDSITTFINGEYRYIKNRLLELREPPYSTQNENEDSVFKEISINKSKLTALLDKLLYPVIKDLRNKSNNKSFDNSIKIIGDENYSSISPLMLCYIQLNSHELEILDILPENNSAINSLLHYCEDYSKNNHIRIIHMLSDIENPIQNFALKKIYSNMAVH